MASPIDATIRHIIMNHANFHCPIFSTFKSNPGHHAGEERAGYYAVHSRDFLNICPVPSHHES